jgi:hypothetical protein
MLSADQAAAGAAVGWTVGQLCRGPPAAASTALLWAARQRPQVAARNRTCRCCAHARCRRACTQVHGWREHHDQETDGRDCRLSALPGHGLQGHGACVSAPSCMLGCGRVLRRAVLSAAPGDTATLDQPPHQSPATNRSCSPRRGSSCSRPPPASSTRSRAPGACCVVAARTSACTRAAAHGRPALGCPAP